MTDRPRLALALGLLPLVLAGPATAQALPPDLPLVSPEYGEPPAPSAFTVQLLAAARPTEAYLARADRLAAARAGTARLRAYARRARPMSADLEAVLAARVPATVTADPLDRAALAADAVAATSEGVLSRLPRLLRTPGAQSIAVDRAIAARAAADLAALEAASGPAFDALYSGSQREGLLRLVDLYKAYVQNGDDAVLRRFAVHALPQVRARLATLPSANAPIRAAGTGAK